MWDSANQTVTSPRGQSEAADVAEFENQDWVKDILNGDSSGEKRSVKAYANPNVAVPFKDNFSVGTIHGTNTPQPPVVSPDIKDELDADGLLYSKHCLNLKHKDNKNNFKQMF